MGAAHRSGGRCPSARDVVMLEGLRVIELASEAGALAGKMLADLGADVVVVEPPGDTSPVPMVRSSRDAKATPKHRCGGGTTTRRSARWSLDLEPAPAAQDFADLALTADIVVEGEAAGRLAALDLDHPRLRSETPSLIWVSVTPFGRRVRSPTSHDRPDDTRRWRPGVELRLRRPFAPAGPGRRQPGVSHRQRLRGDGDPDRGPGTVTRPVSGQHVDVSMHAAANVTTESGSFVWLVAQRTVQRQTGRHADDGARPWRPRCLRPTAATSHRLPTPRCQRLPGHARLAGRTRAERRVPRRGPPADGRRPGWRRSRRVCRPTPEARPSSARARGACASSLLG